MIEVKTNVIRDVLAIPHHDRNEPETLGPCTISGKEDAYVLGIVKANPDLALPLKAIQIWKIDREHFKFHEIPSADVVCSRVGIVTSDGGS